MSLIEALVITIFLIGIGIWLIRVMRGHYKESQISDSIQILIHRGYCVIYKNKHIERTRAGYYIIYYFSKKGDFEQEEVYTDIQDATNKFIDLTKVKDVPIID
jgi:hypothetical protein